MYSSLGAAHRSESYLLGAVVLSFVSVSTMLHKFFKSVSLSLKNDFFLSDMSGRERFNFCEAREFIFISCDGFWHIFLLVCQI